MNILTINSGSSSLKYKLFERSDILKCIHANNIIKIGAKGDHPANHVEALELVTRDLTTNGPIRSFDDVDAIGHRVVHGGTKYYDSNPITHQVIEDIRTLGELAPLHNPPNLAGIEACLIYNKPQVAVWDTAFHKDIPPEAYSYFIPPTTFGDNHKIRKYGFHGISYRYIWGEIEKQFGSDKKAIIAHLGNGCSIAAVDKGKSIDTTMGLTPLEGIPMGTRPGDLDAGVLLKLQEIFSMDSEQTSTYLNKQCGFQGLSGISNDVELLYQAADDGNTQAQLTLDAFAYRVRKYIGSYMAALGGADIIVFTGGIGTNAPKMRESILRDQEWAGIVIDNDQNSQRVNGYNPLQISKGSIDVYAMQTNEELVIAQDTIKIMREL